MGAETFAYPFLFIALFFETFILVTFLSAPARHARRRAPASESLPAVAVIVPCLNEGDTVVTTVETLLALDYPKDKLEIIVVDNGSTDNTAGAVARFAENPRVKILSESTRGKHFAMNTGIRATDAEFVGCLDADSFVEPGALREVVAGFESAKVAAVTAAMSVHKPGNILQHMQNAEYIFGITLRHTMSSLNGLYVTPGPFSFYRREVIVSLGGFRHGHQTEDLEMALRIQKAGYQIGNAPHARVYTKAPRTIPALLKQRTRWTSGFLRNATGDYWSLVGNPKHGALGLVVLPIGLLAIASGIIMFFVALYMLVKSIIDKYLLYRGIPYHFSFGWPTLDWFYFPASLYALLVATALVLTLSTIVIGKRMSKTPGSLGRGLFAYVFIYGLIAPFWLMRAGRDVLLGKVRSWR